jgi:hypothetical protein
MHFHRVLGLGALVLLSAPTSAGPRMVLENCVLHAGGGKQESGGPSTCWFNAECGVPNKQVPNDGFVSIDCKDSSCICTIERKQPRHIRPVTFRFKTDHPVGANDCEALLVEQCMKGMPPPVNRRRREGTSGAGADILESASPR